MQIIEVSAPIPVIGGATMVPGERYALTSSTAGQLLQDTQLIPCPDGKMRPITMVAKIVGPAQDIPIPKGRSMNGRTIWAFRFGGHGDIMFLGPVIRTLKQKWPKCRVVVSCGEEYKCSLAGVDCSYVGCPFPMSLVQNGDAVFYFENTIEHNPEAEHTHAIDLFAHKIGIKVTDRRLKWHITDAERVEALRGYPRIGKVRIGVQAAASSPVRSYHPSMLSTVCARLVEMGAEVFIFGRPKQLQINIEGVTNLSDAGISMRESVAVLETCDVAITPDSSLFHVAQALNIPTVALFGPFPAKLRITNPKKTIVIEAKGGCAPCFFHSSQSIHFPTGKPCSIANFCTVLASIPPEQIVDAVVKLLSRNKCPAV